VTPGRMWMGLGRTISSSRREYQKGGEWVVAAESSQSVTVAPQDQLVEDSFGGTKLL
jgi:hypothetical protein